MFPLRQSGGFFLRCLLIYALLIIPWPGLMDGYRALFRAGGNLLFHSLGSGASVSFKPLSSKDYTKDTTLVLTKRGPQPRRGELDITSVFVGYRPTAFLLALILASPIPWSRRWRALLWGLGWVTLFIALSLWLKLLDVFSEGNVLTVFHFGPFWKKTLGFLVKVLFESPATDYIMPMFIWLSVTFRRGDLERIMATRRPAGSKKRIR